MVNLLIIPVQEKFGVLPDRDGPLHTEKQDFWRF